MKIYTCWITCMLESYQDILFPNLIKKGYTVGMASNDMVVVNHDNQVSALLAFTLYKISEEDIPITKVYEEVISIVNENKFYIYSAIIAEAPNSTWTGSNIFLQPKQQMPPFVSDDKKSNIN
jgi:hypothetical protein